MTFADTLRAAVTTRGLSLARQTEALQRDGHLVTKAMLSSWQTGDSRPRRHNSVVVLADLEQILELAPGTLVQAAGMALLDGRGPARGPELTRLEQELDALHDRWSIPPRDGLDRELVLARCHLDARVQRRVTQRISLRCQRTGADRFVVMLRDEEHGGGGANPLEVAQVRGGTLRRSAHIDAGRATAYEMVLTRPLERGERAIVELGTAWGSSEANDFSVGSTWPADLLVAQVVFHPDHLQTEVRGSADVVQPGGEVASQLGAWRPLGGRNATSTVQGHAVRAVFAWR